MSSISMRLGTPATWMWQMKSKLSRRFRVDVAVGNLHVIDVVHDLHARRIHLPADIQAPVEAVEDLVGALIRGDLGVGDLHAERDASSAPRSP